jgi:hypothetical protein
MRKLVLICAMVVVGVLAFSASGASASWSQCPENAGCVWSGYNGEGQISWWYPELNACHAHNNNPQIRSWWNRTDYYMHMGIGIAQPHSSASLNPAYNPFTGEVCFRSGP